MMKVPPSIQMGSRALIAIGVSSGTCLADKTCIGPNTPFEDVPIILVASSLNANLAHPKYVTVTTKQKMWAEAFLLGHAGRNAAIVSFVTVTFFPLGHM